jgi:hypothetical protein
VKWNRILIKNFDIDMKGGRFILSFLFPAILLSTVSCSNGGKRTQNESDSAMSASDTAYIFFNEYEHDFGKVAEGEKIAYTFTYENKGNAPLVISQATTTCGCTVSRYSTKPVLPGSNGTIEVIFDSSGRNGRQTKTITVRSNATKPLVLLKITGEVTNNNN